MIHLSKRKNCPNNRDHLTPDVVELCRKLDGLPLATELAAARIGILGANELLAGMERGFEFFSHGSMTAPARHQDLRATLDWSYDLLTPTEQLVLVRLSVCAERIDFATAKTVAAGPGVSADEVIQAIAGLAEKSLIEVHRSGTRVTYDLLSTTRAYARDKLEACEDYPATRRGYQSKAMRGDRSAANVQGVITPAIDDSVTALEAARLRRAG